MGKTKKVKSAKKRLKTRLWNLVREYVYLRDKSRCQWCLRPVEGQNRHPSHVYGKKAYPWLEFEPDNVKTLCFHCHINKWHLNPLDGYTWFSAAFPDRYARLQALKMEQHKLLETELEEAIKDLEVLIEEESNRNK